MDISEKRTVLNKTLSDFMSEASQSFMNLSLQLKNHPDNADNLKQLDRIFKKLIDFNRTIGIETNNIFNELESINLKLSKAID